MKKLLCVLMFGMVFGQTKLETRVYEYDMVSNGLETLLDLFELTGYNFEYAKVEIAKINNATSNYPDGAAIKCNYDYLAGNGNTYRQSVGLAGFTNALGAATTIFSNHCAYIDYIAQNGQGLGLQCNFDDCSISATLHLAITAEFPEEDTGYIEEGFDYCIDVGANLVASPCRDEMDIIDTLPSEIASSLTGIIGQGVAATNQDGNWVGSLSGLGGGNGYWMLSNVSACFNYNCAEN